MSTNPVGASSTAAPEISEATALPRAYQLDTDAMRLAYSTFQPESFRYVFRSGVKWPTLKKDALPRAPFTIPFELRGKPDAALLAIDLPGGPGSRQNQGWKEKFDVGQYRVIVADWRGVGQSTPVGCVEDNTIDALVDDIEALRVACAKTPDEKLLLRGGSWGMTVACAYAAKYPDKVAGMVLGLPFLARAVDSQWNYNPDGGLAARYPEAYARFQKLAPAAKDYKAIMRAYGAALASEDPDAVREAYAAFTDWENARGGETQIMDRASINLDDPNTQQRVARARLMVAYTERDFDLGENGLVGMLSAIPPTVPVIVVAHSDDPLCAPDSLAVLQAALPQAEFIVKSAGFHWVSPEAQDTARGFDNSFVTEGYPFAASRIGLQCAGKVLAPLPRPVDGPVPVRTVQQLVA